MIDALGERAERDEVLSFIEKITNWKLPNLHILAMSRPDPVTNDYLGSKAVNLQSTLVNVEIRIHTHESLQSGSQLKKWRPEIKEEIMTTLM